MKKQEKLKSYYKQHGNNIVYFLLDKRTQRYFKGVAVCQPSDTFNLETGIEIAKQKARVKLNAWYVRELGRNLEVIQQLKDSEQEVQQLYNTWNNKMQKSFEVLTKVLGEVNNSSENE